MVLSVFPLKHRAAAYGPAEKVHMASTAQQDAKVIISFDCLFIYMRLWFSIEQTTNSDNY